jgi:3-deoxy-D-manno-octulosonic-acid transferase
LQESAAVQVADAAELAGVLEDLLTDAQKRQRIGENGLHVVAVNRGSLMRLLELIEPLLGTQPAYP